MTQEEKQLLLKDLCARLPYGVKMLHEGWNYEWDDKLSTVERVVGIDENFIYTKVIDTHNGEEYRDDKHCIDLFDDKLFLRPMSSMTEMEKQQFNLLSMNRIVPDGFGKDVHMYSIKCIDWLNANHLDYRGLIPLKLALEAKEGMYNTKTE